MSETKTLSKVEHFAIISARDKMQEVQITLNELVGEIAASHGVDEKDGPDWQFNRDFTALIHTPRKKEPAPDVLEKA